MDKSNQKNRQAEIQKSTEAEGEGMNIDETLNERGNRYGIFAEHARITQNLKRAMADSPNWSILSDDKKEALEMIQHKIGRILNGDPEYHDSWHDMIGYAKLVSDTLLSDETNESLESRVRAYLAAYFPEELRKWRSK
jgi:hypothetical protein